MLFNGLRVFWFLPGPFEIIQKKIKSQKRVRPCVGLAGGPVMLFNGLLVFWFLHGFRNNSKNKLKFQKRMGPCVGLAGGPLTLLK